MKSYDVNTTVIDFKLIMDVDGGNQCYGYLLSNPGCNFYDHSFGYDSIVQMVDLGLEPLRIFDTLIEWYPEIESSLRTYGVVLNDVYIPYEGE